jgi:signal transduction histidine kinase
VHVSVEDSGPGVPEEFREQLFEEFSRAQDAGARGTGLGLFLVRSLAQAQDGGADYRPRPSGGSVFTITLPEG